MFRGKPPQEVMIKNKICETGKLKETRVKRDTCNVSLYKRKM